MMRTQRRLTVAADSSRRGQRGQALVFVTVTILVMVIAMMMTYSIGQLTNQKTRLQNTADAAAYSAALAQARDYNFSAYMNRAMIANDVAVAQIVALRSWSENFNNTFKSSPKGLTVEGDPEQGGLLTWVRGGPLYGIFTFLEEAQRLLASGMSVAAKGGTEVLMPILQVMNSGFALTQKVYHYSTALTVAQILGVDDKFNEYMRAIAGFDLSAITNLIKFGNEYNVVKMNDPDAAISLLGFASYGYNVIQWFKFTENRNPVGPWGQDSSTTNVDTLIRRKGLYWEYTNYNDPDDECPSYSPGVCVRKDALYRTDSVTTPKDYTTAPVANSTADNILKEYDGPRKDRYTSVVLSSRDDFTKDRNGSWYQGVPLLIDLVIMAGPGPTVGTPPGYNGWFLKMLFHSADGVELWNDERQDTVAGAGKGYKKNPGSWNDRWKTHDETAFFGLATWPVGPLPFWGYIHVPSVPFKSGWANFPKLSEANISTGNASGYQGGTDLNSKVHINSRPIFRTYRDVTDIEQGTDTAHQNWTSPPILVEVERKTGTIKTVQPGGYAGCTFGTPYILGQKVSAVFAQGNFNVGDGSSANCMRALAKAEAYFLRPTDLFPRADQKTEYGSLYSPYWQARLVKTTAVEQTLSLITHYCTGQPSVTACASQLISDFRVVGSDFVTAVKQALQ